jgi:hypothetical protein
MASFSSSNLVAAQAKLSEQFTKSEWREKVLPTLTLGLDNGDPLIPGATELRKREDRPVYGYATKRSSNALLTQRTATHTGQRPDSYQIPFTWATYAQTFSISLKMMDTNVYGFDTAMQTGIKNCILDIHSQIETDAVNNLLTYKTQVAVANPIGTRVPYNAANRAYEIAAGDSKQFYQLAKTVMKMNRYNDPTFDILSSASTIVNSDFYASQGTGNAQNTAFQYAGMNPVLATDLTDANYANGVALVMPKYTFCLIPWIPKQNRQGYGDYNSYVGGFGSMMDPMGTGLEFAVHGYSLRSDTTSQNGVAQDVEMQFEMSVDVAFAISPLSTANASPVFEFAQL